MNSVKLLQQMSEILDIGNDSLGRVLKRNLQKGIPNVFCRKGKIYYQTPEKKIIYKDIILDNHEQHS